MAANPQHDTFDLEGQERAKEKAAKDAALRERLEAEGLKWIMQNRRGRRFIYGVIERAGVYRSSFHTNALTMAHNEGRRNEGLELTSRIMEHCPELWTQMLGEQKETTND